MIGEKRVLAVIPARGGSKGVPRKNIREAAGKPLIAWTIAEAKCSRYLDRVIVSTDDAEIAQVVRGLDCEVPFLRPAELSRDDTPGVAPALHALEAIGERYDLLVLLQPTSPLRSAEDIDGCIESAVQPGCRCCVSVTEVEKSPYWMYRVDGESRLLPLFQETFTRRQDIPKVYTLNGAVYVADSDWLREKKSFLDPETRAYLMPKARSLDIDTEEDLVIFNILNTKR